MVECLGQERETFQLLPCGWAAHSPLPPPPCMSSPVSCPLLLGRAVAARAISHPQSGAGTGRPLNTGCLLCPQEHRLPICSRRSLQEPPPSALPRAGHQTQGPSLKRLANTNNDVHERECPSRPTFGGGVVCCFISTTSLNPLENPVCWGQLL